MSHILINKNIANSEECIRCIYFSLMIGSNNHKLKREAFLPAKGHNDVSLLRLLYTDLSFCITHGENTKMNGQTFCALASITSNIVNRNNEWALSEESKNNKNNNDDEINGVQAKIQYAPMSKGEYVSKDIDIYTDDTTIDLPMHADLVYNDNMDGDVKTKLRKYANELVKRVKYSMNENIYNYPWLGNEDFSNNNNPI
jgi:hypothetical protein